MPGTELIEM